MTNKPKSIGTFTETAVARYLQTHGFPDAERIALHGVLDQGDVVSRGLVWEVKGGKAAEKASDAQVASWLAETERERINRRADHGILILKRAGKGAANAGQWWAIVQGGSMLSFLTGDEYGEPGYGAAMRLLLSDMCDLLVSQYGTDLDSTL